MNSAKSLDQFTSSFLTPNLRRLHLNINQLSFVDPLKCCTNLRVLQLRITEPTTSKYKLYEVLDACPLISRLSVSVHIYQRPAYLPLQDTFDDTSLKKIAQSCKCLEVLEIEVLSLTRQFDTHEASSYQNSQQSGFNFTQNVHSPSCKSSVSDFYFIFRVS